ncbi:MAG: hypothetical protein J6V40_00505 [Clostridia bacterium]|nr:hypothetical protein [Clostridia bacterium]
MEKYSIYTGSTLTEDMYLATWKLDNKTFDKKDLLSKGTALKWLKYSNNSTIVLWNNETNSLVGYITPFLLTHEFSCKYIVSNFTYKEEIDKSSFAVANNNVNADIYIFSTVIDPKYRDIMLDETNTKSSYFNKTAFKVLNESLVDWICEIKKKGVSINYIFGDAVSPDGMKYLQSLGMQPCVSLHNDCKLAKVFTPSMFRKCSNVNNLYKIYENESLRKPFNKNILKNHEYLSIKDDVLYYKDINLLDLVEKYHAPLEVAYTPMIEEKIKYLKDLFASKIAKYKYPASYNYAYATKANYYSEVVLTALNHVDMLETSSAYDIDIIYKLAKDGYIKPGYTIICNGFKNEKYVTTLNNLLSMGLHIIPIIENEKEFDLISSIKDHNIDVGLRYNSDFESRLIKNNFSSDEEFDNRFGFDRDVCFKMAEKINNTPNLTLKVLHFHFGGSITDIDNYIKGYSNIMQVYCDLKKQYNCLEYFDFGGGFPIKYSLTYSFDYDKLVDKMIKATMNVCKENKIPCPNLIGEHGRFTTGDHSFYIYKIDFTKSTGNKMWYIINGSLMNMAPDIWGIQQDFTILPINLYNNTCIPVCLGGETCDPDDRYFLNDNNVKLFMPTIKEGETLYIAIFSIGAYQEIISGIGGLHHCLIPEGNELVIYENNGKKHYITPNEVTDSNKVYNLLDYDDENYMKHFFKK